MPHRGRDRRRIVGEVLVGIVTAYRHDSAERHLYQVGGLERAMRSVEAERRDRADYQARVFLSELAPERDAPRERFVFSRQQDDVGVGGESREYVARFRLINVKRDALLVEVVAPEKQALLGIARGRYEWPDAARF